MVYTYKYITVYSVRITACNLGTQPARLPDRPAELQDRRTAELQTCRPADMR